MQDNKELTVASGAITSATIRSRPLTEEEIAQQKQGMCYLSALKVKETYYTLNPHNKFLQQYSYTPSAGFDYSLFLQLPKYTRDPFEELMTCCTEKQDDKDTLLNCIRNAHSKKLSTTESLYYYFTGATPNEILLSNYQECMYRTYDEFEGAASALDSQDA